MLEEIDDELHANDSLKHSSLLTSTLRIREKEGHFESSAMDWPRSMGRIGTIHHFDGS